MLVAWLFLRVFVFLYFCIFVFSGREYVGGLAGLKDRIQKQSKEDLPCEKIVEMVKETTFFNQLK